MALFPERFQRPDVEREELHVASFGIELDALLGGLFCFEEGAVPGEAVVAEHVQHRAVE